MNAVAGAERRSAPRILLVGLRDRVAWRHPEWWTIAISGITWLLLVDASGRSAVPGTSLHVHHASSGAAPPGALLLAIVPDLSAWMLMVAAMMFPVVLAPIQVTAARSLWNRRHRG